jgi:membrane protein implicated in regulation of membrane protease activity
MLPRMSTTRGPERARRLAVLAGLVLLGLAVALGVFIQSQPGDPGPPEDVPRALAVSAVYATVGLLAIVGAFQRRPAILVATGALCVAGTILSVALIGFAVPGLVLILLGWRMRAPATRHWSEVVIGAAVVLLVASAAIAPLVMAEGRCWQATRSPTDPPTYTVINVIPCGGPPVPDASGQDLASGFESGVLTTGGGLVEAILLIGALALTAVTGRTRTSRGVLP